MDLPKDIRYGFRHDPMKWAAESRSLQAAIVRAQVLGGPADGDREMLETEIDKILAQQKEDGGFEEDGCAGALRLIELGCPPDRPELRRAVDAICRARLEKDGSLGSGEIRLARLTGWKDESELVKLLPRPPAELVGVEQLTWGCPWTPVGDLEALWLLRRDPGVSAALTQAFKYITDNMNEIGCMSYKDPWGHYLDLAGVVGGKPGRAILLKLLPILLRSQQPDGGWGAGYPLQPWTGQSVRVFRALVRHGLLERLRTLPALPPDWKVARSIPAPAAKLRTMTWGGGSLWVYSPDSNEAISVSVDDGTTLKRVGLPEGQVCGIGWWGESLAVTQENPKRVLQVDPDTGRIRREVSLEERVDEVGGVAEVDGRLWIADATNWVIVVVDPDEPEEQRYQVLAAPVGPCQADIAPTEDGIWHVVYGVTPFTVAPMLVKSGRAERLLEWRPLEPGEKPNTPLMDWGEKPFGGGPVDSVGGIAWDGRDLWVIDNESERICVIEKT